MDVADCRTFFAGSPRQQGLNQDTHVDDSPTIRSGLFTIDCISQTSIEGDVLGHKAVCVEPKPLVTHGTRDLGGMCHQCTPMTSSGLIGPNRNILDQDASGLNDQLNHSNEAVVQK
jgi:hypothetical protein